MEDDDRLFVAKSRVIQYEVRLRELIADLGAPLDTVRDSRRLACCVSILQDLLDEPEGLGPLQSLLELILRELVQSAYSDQHTASVTGRGLTERLPFFQLATDLDAQLAVVTEELDGVKYRIAEAEHQRDMLTVRLKTAGNEAAAAIGRMDDDIKRLKAQLEHQARVALQTEEHVAKERQAASQEIERWRSAAQSARHEVARLRSQLSDQEDLRAAMHLNVSKDHLSLAPAATAGATGDAGGFQVKTISDVTRLLLIRNKTIDEYDTLRWERHVAFSPNGSGTSMEFAAAISAVEAEIKAEAGPRGQEGSARDMQEETGPLWDAFYSKWQYAPLRPRSLTQDKTMRIIRELSAAHLQVIEAAGQAGASQGFAPSLKEFLWIWFRTTYLNDSAVWVAMYSFFRTIKEGVVRSALTRLLYKAMIGEVAEGLWRYSLQWRRVVDAITMRDPADFRRVATSVFPGVKAEESEAMVADFISAVSTTDEPLNERSMDFLAERLLSDKDIRIKRWLKMLRFKDTDGTDCFEIDRFLDIAAKLFPTATREALLVAFTAATSDVDASASASIELLSAACSFLEAGMLPTPSESSSRTDPEGRQRTPPAASGADSRLQLGPERPRASPLQSTGQQQESDRRDGGGRVGGSSGGEVPRASGRPGTGSRESSSAEVRGQQQRGGGNAALGPPPSRTPSGRLSSRSSSSSASG